jgi:excisionase family DNA binding protein
MMIENVQTDRPYMTTPQASEYSGLTKNYLAALLRRGSLEGFQIGRDWCVYNDSLEKFLSVERRRGPKGPRKKKAQEVDQPSTSEQK